MELDRDHLHALRSVFDTVLVEDWMAPRGTAFALSEGFVDRSQAGKVIVHPSTAMMIKHNGRTPLWTRHERGVIEAERDRRKHGA